MYEYGMRLRGFSIGCQPMNGLIDWQDTDGKYHNKKTVADGIKFDSKLEAERYAQLKILERAGVIRDLELQPEYELIPSFKKDGKTWRKTVYKADFRYCLMRVIPVLLRIFLES